MRRQASLTLLLLLVLSLCSFASLLVQAAGDPHQAKRKNGGTSSSLDASTTRQRESNAPTSFYPEEVDTERYWNFVQRGHFARRKTVRSEVMLEDRGDQGGKDVAAEGKDELEMREEADLL